MAPVIVATDKTQLTQFSGNKSAYPVYLTIGNLPKAIRRKPSKNACVLLGYLSVQKLDRSTMTELEHRSRVQRMFHQSMKIILQPLVKAGTEGVAMACSNGDTRRVFPILSSYVADYPEQCLVACAKYGTCPKCRQKANNLQDLASNVPARTAQWTLSVIADAQSAAQGSKNAFHKTCMEHDVAGGTYEPFWKDLPFTDIHKIITPDVLHQLYQGVFKHLIEWCQFIAGEKELDQRIRTLPHGYGLRHFKSGISALSQISGSERKNMAKILLGCMHDLMPPEGNAAVKALLDFLYLAQYPTHDTQTLGYLRDSLAQFHAHKSYFVNIGVRDNLNLPKLHALCHYVESIENFGTTDNYNTEMFERLHIDFAKEGWRATNQRDEFPQMVQWLSRQEKISYFERVVACRQRCTSFCSAPAPSPSSPPPSPPPFAISIAKRPQYLQRHITVIEQLHKAPEFAAHLKRYLNTLHPFPVSGRREAPIEEQPLPFDAVDIFTNCQFVRPALHDEPDEKELVRALPISKSHPFGHFDTVVFYGTDNAESTGLLGTSYV